MPARGSYARTNGWNVGAYGRVGSSGAGLTMTASILASHGDATVSRVVGMGALARTAGSDVDLSSAAMAGAIRYEWTAGPWTLGPLASIDYAVGRLSRFAERGAGALDLSAGSNSDSWHRYGLGAFANHRTDRGHVDLGIRYVMGPRNDADARLMMAGSATPFEVRAGQGAGRGVLLQGSGILAFGDGWTLGGQGSLFVGSSENAIAGYMRLSKSF